ncbi:putative fad-dependent pyridine nucleotide-disulfide protein [Neofusicoccum parvum UCRNP2]|uniref:Putative fad-dependent pyridine nucleotide-disulfide protein n=1 Tax=Botryosphaeria parva (strain UCR-NP2) TaxID=1287680 RepID=R1GJE3_BOTPV|nr:putative fad-dependent pyridine nucleotide-disulfide protein [Neofusicoccum parvum UCRNP2]
MLSYVLAVVSEGSSKIKDGKNIALLCIAGALIPTFVFWMDVRVKKDKPALIPNALWRNTAFSTVCMMVFLTWAVVMTVEYYFSLFFQEIQDLSALQTSIRFLPNVVAGIILTIIIGMVLHKYSAYWIVVSVSLFSAISPMLLAITKPEWSYWYTLFWAMLLSALAADVLFVVSNLVITNAFPGSTQALAGAVFNTVTQFGTAVAMIKPPPPRDSASPEAMPQQFDSGGSPNDYIDKDYLEDDDEMASTDGKQRITIIGTGWAGYTLATSLDETKFAVTIISPQPSLVYTPLLASAATAKFAFYLAEEPIRGKKKGIRYVKATVEDIDFDSRMLRCKTAFDWCKQDDWFDEPFERLVIAPGCVPNLFGTPGVERWAQFIKTVDDARQLRRRLFEQLEKASMPGLTEQQVRDKLRVIIVGGGPTGVEICAEMWDLAHSDLQKLYPGVADKLSIAIHDVAPHILSAYDQKLYEYARERLVERNIEVRTNSHIERVEQFELYTKEDGRLPCGLLIWATGNKNVPLIDKLQAKKAKGLVRLLTDNRLRVYKPNADGGDGGDVWKGVYGLGDACDVEGAPLPTTAEVAVQKARYLASVLNSDSKTPYKFRPKGLVTYIGSHDGIIQDGEWTGKMAWLSWRQGSLTWTRSLRARSMIFLTWGVNWLFGSELARL